MQEETQNSSHCSELSIETTLSKFLIAIADASQQYMCKSFEFCCCFMKDESSLVLSLMLDLIYNDIKCIVEFNKDSAWQIVKQIVTDHLRLLLVQHTQART